MSEAESAAKPERAKMATLDQVSAGGVVFRRDQNNIEIVITSVGNPVRWQLPKGLVDPGETPEVTALREVREEAGIEANLIAPLSPVEYWYVGHRGKQRVRFHKLVYFFLMAYARGDVGDHDHEVHEARWVSLEEAQTMLAFKGERQAVAQAASMFASGTASKDEG